MSELVRRCEHTNNPCGTDTMRDTTYCTCTQCVLWIHEQHRDAVRIIHEQQESGEKLTAENARLREQIDAYSAAFTALDERICRLNGDRAKVGDCLSDALADAGGDSDG